VNPRIGSNLDCKRKKVHELLGIPDIDPGPAQHILRPKARFSGGFLQLIIIIIF
jgi:hypothetical protein